MNKIAMPAIVAADRPLGPRIDPPWLRRMGPGLCLSAILAFAAMYLGSLGWLAAHGIGSLTVAIALGILVGNTAYARFAPTSEPGVGFSKQTLLRAGVVLYGLRLTLHDVGQVGVAGVLIDGLVVTSTFLLSVMLGTRLFHLERETSMLIGAGSAICGAAAVMASEPVVGAKSKDVATAVATVVLFGTASMFLYPALYNLLPPGSAVWGSRAFGVYTGSTIHEVAQVFAAGRSVSESVANTAVITKMVRVMMLAPFLMCLSAWMGRDTVQRSRTTRRPTPTIPWFAVGFVGVVIFNSLDLLPHRLSGAGTLVDTVLLAMAMAALGLTTRLSALRAAGPKPLLLGAILLVWLIVGGGAINVCVDAWLQ